MATRVLVGTTNPSKMKLFRQYLQGYDVELLSLRDLEITAEPEETGITPVENACQKAMFYGRFFDKVICNDSGMYFVDLPMDDPRQPGLNIRSPQGVRLDDEEMICYYSELAHSLGGKALASYYNGMAVYNNGVLSSFEAIELEKKSAFYLVDTPVPERRPGWPLDSISVNRSTGHYFVDARYDNNADQLVMDEYRQRLIDFWVTSLGLTKTTL
ncbi:MAG: non-canonical purine NTP pyrophosphatase [Faecalibacterium sp.]|nr:non-canonical purine NTP pyrophosphatase [Faecalibacterium sp.]